MTERPRYRVKPPHPSIAPVYRRSEKGATEAAERMVRWLPWFLRGDNRKAIVQIRHDPTTRDWVDITTIRDTGPRQG